MKKLLFLALFTGFSYFGSVAQTAPGNSAYGHSHKKAKKVKKHHRVYSTTVADRRAINTTHRTTIKTITSNDALNNQQQKDQIKQANVTHKTQMKAVTKGKK